MNAQGYFIAALIGAVVTFLALGTCNVPETRTETVTIHDTTIVTVTVPPIEGKAAGKIKYVYLHGKTDTILERVYITTASGDTVSEFTAVLDTIQRGDTLHLEYNYPSSIFKYSLSRQPVEYKYYNTVTTNTVTLQPTKFSWGLQAGFGYLVSFRTGQSALGAYFGVGGNYRL